MRAFVWDSLDGIRKAILSQRAVTREQLKEAKGTHKALRAELATLSPKDTGYAAHSADLEKHIRHVGAQVSKLKQLADIYNLPVQRVLPLEVDMSRFNMPSVIHNGQFIETFLRKVKDYDIAITLTEDGVLHITYAKYGTRGGLRLYPIYFAYKELPLDLPRGTWVD